jgi:hypothetical protein
MVIKVNAIEKHFARILFKVINAMHKIKMPKASIFNN